MKSVAILLITALALPSFAAKTLVLRVNDAVSHKSIDVNFDGSITVKQPRVFAEGEKIKIYSREEGLANIKFAREYPKYATEEQKNELRFDDAQNLMGLCKLYGKSTVIDAEFEKSFWGRESRVIMTQDGNLKELHHNIMEAFTIASWVSSITCK